MELKTNRQGEQLCPGRGRSKKTKERLEKKFTMVGDNSMKISSVQENIMGKKENNFPLITSGRQRLVETQKESRMLLKGFTRIKIL